ncbi:MAG: exodeoxyribonuclease VII large subunit [Candidatus Polarisedimenticolaceae bacterium]|nr:exodeoxyribonuclease VII large subunit [Candidatus Polarisedimenticolaceae bacterium]
MPLPAHQPSRDILSISRLNSEVRAVLDGSFPLLWVEGEISNLARPASGHIYFTLKDVHAQVRCAMFRMRRIKLRFQPENGMQVLVRARVSFYESRGEFQLGVEHMEPAGEGALRLAYEVLKQQLGAEGLFDAAKKSPLPPFPQCIGVITSPVGAAIHDLLSVLQRRFPAARIILYPVPVQGADAAAKISQMIRLADRRAECDLLVLTRGGGSLEDLAAFNDETVARAIHAAQLPVVSAVGHEIDFTIADLVADQRAPTPSAAAELISPDQAALQQQLRQQWGRLMAGLHRQLTQAQNILQHLEQRLQQQHPAARLEQRQQRVDELSRRLTQQWQSQHIQRRERLNQLLARLAVLTPAHRLARFRLQCAGLNRRLHQQMQTQLNQTRQQLGHASQQLHAISPLATLGRGYAIVQQYPSGEIIRNAAAIEPGTRIKAKLAEGALLCQIESVESAP